jgi:hypothetical protein
MTTNANGSRVRVARLGLVFLACIIMTTVAPGCGSSNCGPYTPSDPSWIFSR